ncbi:transporter [Frankia sp. CcI49]|uniref:AEC family transporter n=1 Tax=unclassified Frankia TaxID=2632575 RepID=UPI0006CA3BCB|nr:MULTISPECIES: AEC family transporter [unclassified Frankia]KPM54950.1 transporter [Frankia sp. R43]ONH61155.1 transporter [Frankia sp. CcI49]
MSALVVVFVGLVAGAAVAHTGHLGGDAAHTLNIWLLDIALPALTLHVLHDVQIPSNIVLVVAAPYALCATTMVIYLVAARVLGLSREVVAALIAATAVANTSFVGIPMVTAFFGESWVPVALLTDQLGSYLLLNTVVLVVVTAAAGATAAPLAVARATLTRPSMLALVLALALRPVEYPAWLDEALASIGATLTPLALFSVGLQLRVNAVRRWWRELVLGLTVKLAVAPAAVLGLYVATGVFTDPDVKVALFEIAMPPMVAGAILADRHGLARPLPSLLVGVGVPLSVATLAIWSIPLHP